MCIVSQRYDITEVHCMKPSLTDVYSGSVQYCLEYITV